MRSMFNSAPFSRFDLGRHAFRDGFGLPRLSLGQAPSAYAVEDYAGKIEGLTDSTVKAKLKAQYAECKDKTGLAEIACYAVLGADVVAALKNQSTPSTAPPPLPVAVSQPAQEFPIIPIAIAVLGAGALIYFLATQGKKK
jgi:hypothetical protein